MGRATRTDRALALRDHLLPMVQGQGAVQRVPDGITLVLWQADAWWAMLRTPFSRWPGHDKAKPETHHEAVLLQAKPAVLQGWRFRLEVVAEGLRVTAGEPGAGGPARKKGRPVKGARASSGKSTECPRGASPGGKRAVTSARQR